MGLMGHMRLMCRGLPISPMCPIGPIHATLRRVSRESYPPPHLNASDGEDDRDPAATSPPSS